MRLFYYLLDLSVVNAWLLYCQMMSSSASNNILHHYNFKEDISDGLMKQAAIKKGRLKLNSLESTSKRKMCSNPAELARFDTISHLPECQEKNRQV